MEVFYPLQNPMEIHSVILRIVLFFFFYIFVFVYLCRSCLDVNKLASCYHVNHNGRRLKQVVLICPRSQHWTVSEPNETKDLFLKYTNFSLHWQLWSWIYSSAEGLVVSIAASRKFKYDYTYRNYMASLERLKGRQEGIESRIQRSESRHL